MVWLEFAIFFMQVMILISLGDIRHELTTLRKRLAVMS